MLSIKTMLCFWDNLLPKIEHLDAAGYWLLLLVAFLESLVLVGGIFPGSVLTVFAGAMAAQGYFDVGDLIWFAAIGAILGDGLSFWLGARGKGWFKDTNRFLKPSHLEAGERFFRRHGAKSVFLGRFVGVVRMLVPFIAGLSGMKPGSFYFWNVLSAFAWSASHLLGGYFLGHAWRVFAVWTSRGGIFLAAVAVLLVCGDLLRRFAIKQGKWLLELGRSLWRSAGRKLAANPRLAGMAARHPRLIAFLRGRFDEAHFYGLPLTLLSLAFLYVLFLFGGIVEDVLTLDRIVTVDRNLADLLHFYRDETLVGAFLWITLLGTARLVALGAALATLCLWLWKRRECILPLWVTVAGSAALCALGKVAVRRDRPLDIAAIVETTFSFPSGHAAAAAAFYGFVVYCLWRPVKGWNARLNLFFAGALLILAIGFSRMYLGVHYLSDVLGGFLLGLLWLILGISLAERRRYGRGEPSASAVPSGGIKGATALTIAAGLLFYVHSGLHYNPPRPVPSGPGIRTVGADVVEGFGRYRLPRFTESISGRRRGPLNVVIVARDGEALAGAFAGAGWLAADPASAGSLGRAAIALFENKSYPSAPVSPLFWNGQVNDYAFEKPTPADTVRRRWQVRLWRTGLVTESGMRVFAGAVCHEPDVKWVLLREPDPDLDAAREVLRLDLVRSGAAANVMKAGFVESMTAGRRRSDSRFSTDGSVLVLFISSRR